MEILVSGGGIAGLACALEFGGRGHDVTVVERASHLRLTGTLSISAAMPSKPWTEWDCSRAFRHDASGCPSTHSFSTYTASRSP
ncbi:FAD-dependent oxidoreductase [Mycolicibacterium goodii]|uniref:FAD-dependent oxidoreductase n=1 Tax=Mycolicibacterium goodii TaxID=134601 RepID=UPI00256F233E|nr:FAD-dependent oxidoreductase [Mycolicibacterium goodii]